MSLSPLTQMMPALQGVQLNASTPCCKRQVKLNAIVLVPRETYERTCTSCGTRWTIAREVIRDVAGVRMDRLEWSIDPADRSAAGK